MLDITELSVYFPLNQCPFSTFALHFVTRIPEHALASCAWDSTGHSCQLVTVNSVSSGFLCLSSFGLSPLVTDAPSVLLQVSIQLQTVPDLGSFYTIDDYTAVQRSSYCRLLKVKWIATVSVCHSLQELHLVGFLCRRWCLVQLLSVLVWF